MKCSKSFRNISFVMIACRHCQINLFSKERTHSVSVSYNHSILGNFYYYYLVLCSLLIAGNVGPSVSEGALEFMADSNLKAEKFVGGLEKPTSMAFLGPDDIIVLEKNKGTVMRVVNGVIRY